mgnify:CR=1 FL=1
MQKNRAKRSGIGYKHKKNLLILAKMGYKN